jgi:cytosine/adenosine deaminase-related metal-dependent hydrolase
VTRMGTSGPAGITFINAALGDGEPSSLRIVGAHIASLAEAPSSGDAIVDLEGDRLLPGLINAHDHLQLNSLRYPETGTRYRHVCEWIADVNARRKSDPEFESSVAVARDERLLIGGLKNLLSGVTTVAHHDPLYPCLSNAHYPTRVVRDFGWSHSLYVDGAAAVRNAYGATPLEWPWIIHAAEGVDDAASKEFERLDALGCLRPNTLLVHGIALDDEQRSRLVRAAAGLIWCPSSNLRLFGKTAQVADLLPHGRVALGTDSRMSGARDLLDEMRLAAQVGKLDDRSLQSLVTSNSARLLRLTDRGELRVGARADLLILPARSCLAAANRADVRLVLIDGTVRYGDKEYAQRMAKPSDWSDIVVDGTEKVLARRVAEMVSRARLMEAGVEIAAVAGRAA